MWKKPQDASKQGGKTQPDMLEILAQNSGKGLAATK
jgi:hypothetical protein